MVLPGHMLVLFLVFKEISIQYSIVASLFSTPSLAFIVCRLFDDGYSDRPGLIPGSEDPWRRDRLPTLIILGFPCGLTGKESTCNAGDLGSIPGLGRSPREGKGYPL